MNVVIEGVELPGLVSWTNDGTVLENVHIALQVRKEHQGLLPGDAEHARWVFDIDVVGSNDRDFRGPAVHGKRGDRFLYLAWINVDGDLDPMFARIKLMLHRIDDSVIIDAQQPGRSLAGRVNLSKGVGWLRSGRVDPPAVEWSVTDGPVAAE
jgi:hypothetical protein